MIWSSTQSFYVLQSAIFPKATLKCTKPIFIIQGLKFQSTKSPFQSLKSPFQSLKSPFQSQVSISIPALKFLKYLKSLLETREVEEARFEPTTLCLASSVAYHYTRETGWIFRSKILICICVRFIETAINVNTKTLKTSSVFYFSVGQPHRCIAGNPIASTRPQKFTTSACIDMFTRQQRQMCWNWAEFILVHMRQLYTDTKRVTQTNYYDTNRDPSKW